MVDLTKTNSFLNINIHFFELKKKIDLNCDLNHTSTNFLFLFFSKNPNIQFTYFLN